VRECAVERAPGALRLELTTALARRKADVIAGRTSCDNGGRYVHVGIRLLQKDTSTLYTLAIILLKA
jgi:hypothetical protein